MGTTNKGVRSDKGYIADQVTKYCFQRTEFFDFHYLRQKESPDQISQNTYRL
jgi:hypothetical protein